MVVGMAAAISKMARALLQRRRVIISSSQPSRLGTNEDLAARNQLVLRQVSRDHMADPKLTQANLKAATNTCVAVLVLGASLFNTLVSPELKRLEDREDSLSRKVFKLKQDVKTIKDDGAESQPKPHQLWMI